MALHSILEIPKGGFMKKLFFLLPFLAIFCIGAAKAETLLVPQGSESALATSDYGGVQYGLLTFSTNPTVISDTYGSIVGFVASSNTNTTDCIIFYDTAAVTSPADEQTGTEIARVYLSTNVISASAVITGAPVLGTTYKFPAPIRTKRGIVARANTKVLNIVTILYTKFGR